MAAVGMASGEAALGHGWSVRMMCGATLHAIERELALANASSAGAGRQPLLRLRLLLLAVASSELRLEDELRSLRAALRRRRPAAIFPIGRAGVAMDVIWDLLVFLALVVVGLWCLTCWPAGAETASLLRHHPGL
jgi:hypothetical protein